VFAIRYSRGVVQVIPLLGKSAVMGYIAMGKGLSGHASMVWDMSMCGEICSLTSDKNASVLCVQWKIHASGAVGIRQFPAQTVHHIMQICCPTACRVCKAIAMQYVIVILSLLLVCIIVRNVALHDWWSCSVDCLSVSLSDCHIVVLCKNGREQVQLLLGVETLGDPRNIFIRWGSRLPCYCVVFRVILSEDAVGWCLHIGDVDISTISPVLKLGSICSPRSVCPKFFTMEHSS